MKKRFIKNKKFFEDYQKGYTRVASEVEAYDEIWYNLHNEIYHSSKPGKIPVVLDCSAKINSRSINKGLLRGLDLTNLLVGVLLFCQEHVAVIENIESVRFYQVWVSEEHRSVLRFLWWKDGDLSNPLIDHEMGRHSLVMFHRPVAVSMQLRRQQTTVK